MGALIFSNGMTFEGENFGALESASGELVFSTGMMGYPENLTDPSYKGQILILTYPLVGNYGIPDKKLWESDKIMVSGLIVSDYIDTPYHFQSKKTLGRWLIEENIPGLIIKDTRLLTQIIREKGTILGKISNGEDIDPPAGPLRSEASEAGFYDPNKENLVEQVSTKIINKLITNNRARNILLIDCGAKKNIQRALIKKGVNVITVPWNFDTTSAQLNEKISGVIVSNGPGNPKYVKETIENIQKLFRLNMPILGICLGHQLLSLAAGGDTKKLKYGHRSQNQPCIMERSKRCFITTQNHGFEVSKIPSGFKAWFTNANDGSNEGIVHKNKSLMSVQFHPEATPGPEDTEWIFDFFLEKI
ncbi:MAG: glutamine-hydrolyzing carbamoyl-phosphate synthase small subunit [Candidatus Levybacteria bacterium]|nr:glutamine-hydrolyzing carbamoyl-phosphate synthase small subunit [Candidatus Levybacteria bacterium]